MSNNDTLWEEDNLSIPRIPQSLMDNLRIFDYTHYGSIAEPSPKSDYMLTDSLSYLTGTVPDQYVLSHWGHGINSYSLNFRFAYGDLALIAQVAYGGAYGDAELQKGLWEDTISIIDKAIDLPLRQPSGEARKRKVIVAYSDFRDLGSDFRDLMPASERNAGRPSENFFIFKNTRNGVKFHKRCHAITDLIDELESLQGGYGAR